MSIALSVLEYELKQSESKIESLNENIYDLEEELETTKKTWCFKQIKLLN